MKKHTIAAYAFWILLAEGAGGAVGWLTREGVRIYTETIVKPPFSPPPIVFPVAWTLLYALMGVSAARIALAPGVQDRARALWIFVLQLALNVSWSVIFFNFQQFGLAALWLAGLWGAILWMIAAFRPIEKTAAWLQFPYLVWVSFAGYLNVGVWLLN